MGLNKTIKACVIYIIFFYPKLMIIYLTQKTQTALLFIKNLTILSKYLDFANIFPKKLAVKLPKRFNIYKYLIKLKLSK